jgi:hypothetical protein
VAPIRRPDRVRIERRLREVLVPASALVRLSMRPTTEPYWSRAPHRFDDPDSGDAAMAAPGSTKALKPLAFGVCYAADSVETAFCESVIRDGGRFVDGQYEVPADELIGRHIIRFAAPRHVRAGARDRSLVLADFTGEGLKVLGLNNDVSATDDYAVTRLWARAIHDADTRWAGIRYVSRQKNDGLCYAIFDRSGLRLKASEPLRGAVLDGLCERFGVVGI